MRRRGVQKMSVLKKCRSVSPTLFLSLIDTLIKDPPWDFNLLLGKNKQLFDQQIHYYYFGEINWIFFCLCHYKCTYRSRALKKWDVKQLVKLHYIVLLQEKYHTTSCFVIFRRKLLFMLYALGIFFLT